MQSPHELVDKDGFRLRGSAASRVDSFSDVVFGFALTLIVISQAVPRTFDQLRVVLAGFFPFAICFVLFLSIWLAHYRFFRRYGVHDVKTLWINFALLFTVLLYIYPLKFLFTFVAGHPAPGVFTNPYQSSDLLVIYGAGFCVIEVCFAALYGNAWLQRRQLALNPLERTITAVTFWNYIGNASIGLICCLLAGLLPLRWSGDASYGFLLLIVWGRLHAVIAGRRVRSSRALLKAQDNATLPQRA